MSRATGRKIFQLVALVLVAWGIVHSLRSSADQLADQEQALRDKVSELQAQAEQAEDPEQRDRLVAEAEMLSRDSRDYWKANPWLLLAAGGFYAVGMLPASLFWRRCLVAMEQPGSPLLTILWAYFYGNLGKYFPGKAMVLVLRVAALEPLGIKKTATVITIFMETLTMMSVGGAAAAICLILLGVDWRMTLLAIGLLVVTFIPTSPPVLRILLPKLQRGVDPEVLQGWADRLTWRLFFRGWFMLFVTWGAFGISLGMVLFSLPSAHVEQVDWTTLMLSSLGACAMAVVLGFVSLIPGGAGVREVVLSTVLAPVVGPVAALCAAVWMRIVWLATELAVVGLIAAIRTRLPTIRDEGV